MFEQKFMTHANSLTNVCNVKTFDINAINTHDSQSVLEIEAFDKSWHKVNGSLEILGISCLCRISQQNFPGFFWRPNTYH